MQTRLHYLKLEQKRQRERERKYKAMSRGISQFHTFLDFTLHEVRKFSIQVNQPIIQIFCKIYGNFFFPSSLESAHFSKLALLFQLPQRERFFYALHTYFPAFFSVAFSFLLSNCREGKQNKK